jgi:hypothetical protein
MPVMPCCGGSYLKARKCSDSTVVDLGMTSTNAATFTGAFKYSGTCYYFSFLDAPVSTPPATLLTPIDVASYGSCSTCAAMAPLCTGCTGTAPVKLKLIFSGVALCPDCYFLWRSFGVNKMYAQVMSGNLNGTVCAAFYSGDGSGCHYRGTLANPIVVYLWDYTKGGCSGSPDLTFTIDHVWVRAWASTYYTSSWYLNAAHSPWTYAIEAVSEHEARWGAYGNAIAFRYIQNGGSTCVSGTFSNQITDCGEEGAIELQSLEDAAFYGHLLTMAAGGSVAVIPNGC